MTRPTLYDFPDDPRCYEENDEMMLGPVLLAAPVVEPGCETRTVYLPKGADWYDFHSGALCPGGEFATFAAPPAHPVLLARAGSGIPVNVAEQHFSRRSDARGFHVFPHPGEGSFLATSFEDDGETFAYLSGAFRRWTLGVDCGDTIRIALQRGGGFAPSEELIPLILPVTETRDVELTGATCVGEERTSGGRIVMAALKQA
jgi:alpha-glucosidase